MQSIARSQAGSMFLEEPGREVEVGRGRRDDMEPESCVISR